MKNVKVLIIDDDTATLDMVQYYLRTEGYEVMTADTGQQGLSLAEEHQFNLVLTDWQLPDIGGTEIVKRLKEISPAPEIIIITGYGSVARAIEATKAGAFYFVEKPVELEELVILIEKAIERGQQAEEIRQLRGRLSSRNSYYNMIGSSKGMQDVYEMIDAVAESDANVLIVGESGTGKELIANAIHHKSSRVKRPFVKINCAALPKELIESELFGHTKGAFTGASTDKAGLLNRAESGSLLLDEISEMPLELQPKLLRVLQDRVYYRVGGEKPQEANFRLISATNLNPRTAVQEGRLREDLYYRINTVEIPVPPLRERGDDISQLAEHFLREYAAKYERSVFAISQQAYERLIKYSWPGNVRELENVIERAVLLCKGDTIEATALPLEWVEAKAVAATNGGGARAGAVVRQTENLPEISFETLGHLIINQVPDPKSGLATIGVLNQIEAAVVAAALERTKGNKQAAANLLGLYRPRLYSLIKKHNLREFI